MLPATLVACGTPALADSGGAVPAPRDGADRAQLPIIPPLFQATARLYGIPPGLFFSIGVAESGGSPQVNGRLEPWPWTLNADGKSYFFDTKEAASAKLLALSKTARNVDIGAMQVSWNFNADLQWDPELALDPGANLRSAAVLLRERYSESGDWWIAVGRYHSPANGANAARYRSAVRAKWQRLYGPLAPRMLAAKNPTMVEPSAVAFGTPCCTVAASLR